MNHAEATCHRSNSDAWNRSLPAVHHSSLKFQPSSAPLSPQAPSLPGPGPAHDATRESKFPPGIPPSMALDTENDLPVPVPRDIAKLFLQ